MPIRAAKAWKTFDYYLEVILAFAIHSPHELEEKWTGHQQANEIPWDKEGEAYQIGMNLYFKRNMIEVLGDFIL